VRQKDGYEQFGRKVRMREVIVSKYSDMAFLRGIEGSAETCLW